MTGGGLRRSLPRRRLAAGLVLALAVVACEAPRPSAPTPSASDGPTTGVQPPALVELPFRRSAWPASGSACDRSDDPGLLGRIEAASARTVRFVLCRPDAAFPARLAHPALGIIDAAAVAYLEADPGAVRELALADAAAGAFRVEAWSTEDAAVRLVRRDPDPGAATERIVLRWAATSRSRAAALRDATVDVADPVDRVDADELETLPEVAVHPRPGLATAYLGFGAGRPFGSLTVRRAFAQGLDTAALARDAFPPGSVAATHLAPCSVTGGCAGAAWYAFNGPAGSAALDAAGFDRGRRLVLRVPDAPIPGLPEPLRAGRAIVAQLAERLEVTVALEEVPVDELRTLVENGAADGLYLWGVATPLADASGYLGPIVGEEAGGAAPARAKGAAAALRDAAAAIDPPARAAALATASDAVRSAAAVVPLVHPGGAVATLADVAGLAVSPLGVDALGDARPGDRRQLVVIGAAEPGAAWCAIASDAASLRLCGLVTPGLLAFSGSGLDPAPALADRCTPSPDARSWTCRLAANARFGNGMAVDAGDVLASLRAQADATGPLRRALPPERFTAWDALFGGPVP